MARHTPDGRRRSRYGWLKHSVVALSLTACSSYQPLELEPRRGPPYLAVVTRTQGPEGIRLDVGYTYRVREQSLSLGIDTVMSSSPSDTLLLSLPPATYEVEIRDVPSKCRIQGGGATKQSTILAAETNTAIIRFTVFCQAQLVIENLSAGQQVDPEFVFRIEGPGGVARAGLIGGADTVLLDGLVPGNHSVRLSHVAENCLVVSDGGEEQTVVIPEVGGVDLAFRVACSDPTTRPKIVAVQSSYQDGVSGFVIDATDPDRDIDRYFWDLTDCRRNSLVRDGGRSRGGLSGGRTGNLDSITVLGVFDVGLSDERVKAGCTALRVVDRFGNSSEIVEAPLRPHSGEFPFATAFNARLFGTSVVQTLLSADDPDNDFLGVFGMARMRDGALGPVDGKPDIGIFNTAGYLDTNLPDVPLGNGRPAYTEYYSVIVYLFDRAGYFRRVEDDDLFH